MAAMYAPTRTLLSATFIVSALMPAALASAADFPLPPPLPAWTWAGFYIGGQIGGFGGTSTFSDPYGPSVFGDKVTTNGFLAGLQLGYDWQVAPKWVVGVVADTSYLDGKGSFTCMQAAATIIGSNCEVTTRAGDHGRPCRLSRRSAEPYARLRQSRRRVDGQPRINPSRQRTIRRLPRRRISRRGDERKRQCVGWNDRRRTRARSYTGVVDQLRI